MMITCHWDTDEIMEIWSGIKIQANGKILIRIYQANKNLADTTLQVKDPFDIPIFSEDIPSIIEGEYWQVAIPLTNYFHRGKYKIEVNSLERQFFYFEYYLESRKEPNQSFLVEYKVKMRNMNKMVKSLKFNISEIPNNFLLQSAGEISYRGAEYQDKKVIVNNLDNNTQKTISWKLPVQPAFLPINTSNLIEEPDEYYVFNSFVYENEPGLELEEINLDSYEGSTDIHYPILVLKDALNHVHRNMRYVRQSKERGVRYAIKYGRGDCTEYSAYLVTLLRKLGIRARLVSGMSRSFHNNWISHAFAEIFLFGSWVPIDPVKPPKPYLQLGNRGELIGLSRKNWLDENNKEFKFEFQAFKGATPKIAISQKITEAGITKLSKEINKKPRVSKLKKLIGKENTKKIKITEKGIIHISPRSEIISALFTDESMKYGKINFMRYLPENTNTIKIDKKLISKQTRLILLDTNGNARYVYHIV